MFNKLQKIFFIFLALTGAAFIASRYFNLEFGHENFWQHHGLLFLILISLFPRLTLFFSSVVSGGVLWWLAFIFAPRVLVAVLATLAYWPQNPLLVVVAWLVAVGGESSEKYVVVRRRNFRRVPNSNQTHSTVKGEVIDVEPIRRD